MTEINCSRLSKTGRDVLELIGLMGRHKELKTRERKIPGLSKRGHIKLLEKNIADRFERIGEQEKTAVLAYGVDGYLWRDWITQHLHTHPRDKEILGILIQYPRDAKEAIKYLVQYLWQDVT